MNRDTNLIIYCHSNPNSFTSAVLQSVISGLKTRNKPFYIIDLYKSGFNPILVVNSTRRRRDLITDPETEEFRKLIKEYDNLIFIYPVWWGGFPAILKGFIDRTFVSGLTYSFKDKKENSIFPQGLMEGKKAFFIYSLDSPFLVALIDPGWYAIKYTIFKYCGFSEVKRLYIYGLKRRSAVERNKWLQKVKNYFSYM